MSELQPVTDETFEEEVLNADGPVLVDFTAAWCGPCKMLDPIVSELAQEWDGKIKVRKFDVDQNKIVPDRFGVLGIPTLLLFENGEIRERITSYRPKKYLQMKFSLYLK
ncbi:MAG: thioredoxin [Chloroflexota bacterium]